MVGVGRGIYGGVWGGVDSLWALDPSGVRVEEFEIFGMNIWPKQLILLSIYSATNLNTVIAYSRNSFVYKN